MTDSEPVTGPSPRRDHALEFRGSGGEYFRIWIINLLLTVLTLGIYSAWATVRNRRYLYASTYLMGSAFDYHATGGQVLKGRLVAVAAVLAYLAVGHWLSPVQPFVLLGMLALLPWVVVQARRFQAHNTSWRDVRFGFERAWGQAYAVYILWPLLIPVTLGLIYPYILFRKQRFLVDNMRFGREAFRLHGGPGLYFLLVFLLALGGGAAYALLFTTAAGLAAGGGQGPAGIPGAAWILVVIAFYAIALVLHVIYRTAVLNDVWNHTRLGEASFSLRLHAGRMLWIALTNVGLVVLTLGLYTPWAQVRMRRYQLSRASATVSEVQVRRLEAAAAADSSATGDELAGAFDLDVGIA